MFSSYGHNRGITLIESIIAILLVTVALLGLLAMQPSAWQTSTKADYVGHGAMILSRELIRQELWVMNPCNAVAAGTVNQVLGSSGQGAPQAGEARYTVLTTTASLGSNVWRITVKVSWPPLNDTGITESIVVTRQEHFRFPQGCV